MLTIQRAGWFVITAVFSLFSDSDTSAYEKRTICKTPIAELFLILGIRNECGRTLGRIINYDKPKS